MKLTPIFLVLADISGYTRFIRLHRYSLIHAEGIITDLLDQVIQASDAPLDVYEIAGDSVTFYAESDGTPAMAEAIFKQVEGFFEAFRKREGELISDCRLCACDACRNVGQLRLKAVLHHGEAAIQNFRQFLKIAGEDVILAHRLLKNSISGSEYVLATDAFFNISGNPSAIPPETRVEYCDEFGEVGVKVWYPESAALDLVKGKRSPLDTLKMTARLDLFTLKRVLTGPKKSFPGLDSIRDDQKS